MYAKIIHTGITTLILAALCLCLVAGFAQNAAAAEPTARALTLQEAFVLGISNSRAVRSATLQPLQADEEYQKARTIYDPSMFMTSWASKTDRPSESLLDGVSVDSSLEEDRWQVQAGIKNRLPTGGTLAFYQEGSKLKSNSDYVYPDPQYQSKIVASLTQPLLKGLGDKEGATNIRVADLNRQIAESGLVRDVSDILMDIASNYWQLYFEQSVIKVNRESLERARDVYQREHSRSSQGLSKPVDVDRAMGAMQTRRSNLLRAENQARATMRQLWLLLNPDEMFVPGKVPYLEIGDDPTQQSAQWMRSQILTEALNQRQEMAIARDTVEVSQQQQSLADHNQLPVLDVKMNYGFNALEDDKSSLVTDPYNDNHADWRVEIAFEWPLGGRSAAAEKRRADYRLRQSKSDMRLVAERVALEIDIVLDELRLAKDELDATREAMDAARKVMDGEEIMFELGQKNNQDLLTVQDYYGSSQKDYYRALSRFNLNLVSLSRVKGVLLSDYDLQEVFAQTRDKSASAD